MTELEVCMQVKLEQLGCGPGMVIVHHAGSFVAGV